MTNHVLVVTGMHRSGTSLITHWLHACGLQVGETLLDAGQGNVEGHFEDLEFLKLHEEMLGARGAGTDGLRTPYEIRPTSYEKAKMAAVIAVKNARFAHWGWKEPRTCLFLDTYAELLPQARYLVLLRDYDEVVQSLLKRDFAYVDDKYRARSWPYRLVWQYLTRARRRDKHRHQHYNRYLKAWVVYNQMIVKALRQLPAERYLVVSYASMQRQCAAVHAFLSTRWSFPLRYRTFSSIYRSELISRQAEAPPANVDRDLLDQARQVHAQLQHYLQASQHGLAAAPALP